MSEFDLESVNNRYKALRIRSEVLREAQFYQIYGSRDVDVNPHLDLRLIPKNLGWTNDNIIKLAEALPVILPYDYKFYLREIGNLNSLLAGHYECEMRTVHDYLVLQSDISEFDDEDWGDVANNLDFQQILKTAIPFDYFGGFAIGFFLPKENTHSEVFYWHEGSQDKQSYIQSYSDLTDFFESKFETLEIGIREE